MLALNKKCVISWQMTEGELLAKRRAAEEVGGRTINNATLENIKYVVSNSFLRIKAANHFLKGPFNG